MVRQPSKGIGRRAFVAGMTAPVAVTLVREPLRAQEATIRVSTTGATVFAEPFLALDLGLYRRAGINAVITQYSGGETSIAAVVTGNADVGVTTPVQLASAFVHDLPVRLIGFCAQYTANAPQPALYVARDSPLRDAKSLEGKTVGVNALQSTNFLGVQTWLTQNNVDVTKVRSVEVPFAQIAAALERGTIDAGVLADPFYSAAKDKLRMLAPVFDSLGPHWAISVWFSRLDYIRANPALIKRFIDVAYQTAKLVNARPDQANPILAKYSKLPVETVNAMARTDFAEAPDPSTCRIELEMAYKFKILPRPVTVTELMALN